MKSKFSMFILIPLSAIFFTAASGSCLSGWEEFSYTDDKKELVSWMKGTTRAMLYRENAPPLPDITLPAETGCTGLFITLIKKGKVRGCFGAFSHSRNSFEETLREYIHGAVFLDPRHAPLERHELDDTEIVLTVTSNPEPVDDINNVDISVFGMFIECDDSSRAVIVPAEFRTTAGIMKTAGGSRCRYYKFRGVTIR